MAEEFQIVTVQVRPIWNPLFRQHPILWWKTRHIRKFIRGYKPSPLERELAESEERAFLFGSTDANGE